MKTVFNMLNEESVPVYAQQSLARRLRGRGARSNASGRYEKHSHHIFDDGWQSLEELAVIKTEVIEESAKSVITRNQSPDLSFDRSVNAYRGCEHGCSYCFARPSHANMGLSPGVDFETKLFAKKNVAEILHGELMKPGYEPRTIAMGTNTDPYQPVERDYRLTRQILQVLNRFNHPVGIVTKSTLILRDLDVLAELAKKDLIKVAISVTTLDRKLSRSMEPRAATPAKRLEAIEKLNQAGIPTSVLVAPIIPAINDNEIEDILKAVAAAGAREAGYVLLRLPLEVRDVFIEWLRLEMPDRADHVLSLIRSMRGGKDYDATWHRRQKGTGPYAWMTGRRFQMACNRLGLNERRLQLSTDKFCRPVQPGEQLNLF